MALREYCCARNWPIDRPDFIYNLDSFQMPNNNETLAGPRYCILSRRAGAHAVDAP